VRLIAVAGQACYATISGAECSISYVADYVENFVGGTNFVTRDPMGYGVS